MRIQIDQEYRVYTGDSLFPIPSGTIWPTMSQLMASLLEIATPVSDISTGIAVSVNPVAVRALWQTGGTVSDNVAPNTLISPSSKAGEFSYARLPLVGLRTQTRLDYSMSQASDPYGPSALVNSAPWNRGTSLRAEPFGDFHPVVPCLEVLPGIPTFNTSVRDIYSQTFSVANQVLPVGGTAVTLEVPNASLINTNVSQLIFRGPLSRIGVLSLAIDDPTACFPYSEYETGISIDLSSRMSTSIRLDASLLANANSASTDSFIVFPTWKEPNMTTQNLTSPVPVNFQFPNVIPGSYTPLIARVVSLNRVLTAGESGFSFYSETTSLSSDSLRYALSFRATAYSD